MKTLEQETGTGLLDRVEQTLATIFSMPRAKNLAEDKALISLASKDVPLLVPGALRSQDTVAFALKLSLCSTLCWTG